MPAVSHRSARLLAGALFLFLLLSGCATMVPQTMALRESWPEGVPLRFEKTQVPFFAQDDYQCGPAALATVMADAGVRVTPDELVRQVYIPERQGSLQAEMVATPRRYGLVGYPLAPRFDDLLREVAAGNPVVILQNFGAGFIDLWHYAVIVGYDYPAGELYLRSGKTEREKMPFTILEYTWKKGDYWAMVALPPDRIPVTATETDYAAAVVALERAGDRAATTRAYATILARWPANLGASIGLANQAYAQGHLQEAEAVLRRAARQHPDSIAVLNNLAQVLSDQGRNAEALALIDRAAVPGSKYAAAVAATRGLILQRMSQTK